MTLTVLAIPTCFRIHILRQVERTLIWFGKIVNHLSYCHYWRFIYIIIPFRISSPKFMSWLRVGINFGR